MIIGIPREIKLDEKRVALTPAGAKAFVDSSHQVLVQRGAGEGSGFRDLKYSDVGAKIIDSAKEVFRKSELIIKVKEPVIEEYKYIKKDQIIFTFFHFSSNRELTKAMLGKKIIGIAYETIQEPGGYLPILAPMSAIAGKIAGQVAGHYLSAVNGGNGKLIGGIPGVEPAKVLIIGGGSAGTCAAKVCAGMGGSVEIFDINQKRLEYLDDILPKNVKLSYFSNYELLKAMKTADVLIGTVYIPGAKTPNIITRDMVKTLKPKTILIDVCIDQGGCFETSRATTHSNPTYTENDIIHYCVANMPGAFPKTSTIALTNATLKYGLDIANKGYIKAILDDQALFNGLEIIDGKITYKAVAEAHCMDYIPLNEVLNRN
ncbi:alanine dehydrogenase [Actinomycetota bacterium]